jgi:hypothetical protein
LFFRHSKGIIIFKWLLFYRVKMNRIFSPFFLSDDVKIIIYYYYYFLSVFFVLVFYHATKNKRIIWHEFDIIYTTEENEKKNGKKKQYSHKNKRRKKNITTVITINIVSICQLASFVVIKELSLKKMPSKIIWHLNFFFIFGEKKTKPTSNRRWQTFCFPFVRRKKKRITNVPFHKSLIKS